MHRAAKTAATATAAALLLTACGGNAGDIDDANAEPPEGTWTIDGDGDIDPDLEEAVRDIAERYDGEAAIALALPGAESGHGRSAPWEVRYRAHSPPGGRHRLLQERMGRGLRAGDDPELPTTPNPVVPWRKRRRESVNEVPAPAATRHQIRGMGRTKKPNGARRPGRLRREPAPLSANLRSGGATSSTTRTTGSVKRRRPVQGRLGP